MCSEEETKAWPIPDGLDTADVAAVAARHHQGDETLDPTPDPVADDDPSYVAPARHAVAIPGTGEETR